MDLRVGNHLKIETKFVKKTIKNEMRSGMDLGGLLERFGVDFSSKLGGKLGPSWHKNLKNEGTKTMSKNVW